MGRYRLRLSASAANNLAEIYAHGFKTFGEAQADRYFEALRDQLDRLCEQPLLYPAVDWIRPGYRRAVAGRHAIYYRLTGETVDVMAILQHQDTRGRL